MPTQLAIPTESIAPAQSKPQAAQLDTCPVRDRCHDFAGYRCGFEQAGTVAACPKRRRMEVEG